MVYARLSRSVRGMVPLSPAASMALEQGLGVGPRVGGGVTGRGGPTETGGSLVGSSGCRPGWWRLWAGAGRVDRALWGWHGLCP
jgi:hypothetical protein